MGRVTRAATHLPADEVKKRAKTDQRSWCRQRWLIIYNALVDPRPAAEIATHIGVSVDTVHQVISKYNRLGVTAVETAGKGGRHNEYLIPICVLMDIFEWQEMHANAEQSSLLEHTLV